MKFKILNIKSLQITDSTGYFNNKHKKISFRFKISIKMPQKNGKVRGAEKGNKGAVITRFRKFFAVLNRADIKSVRINPKIFRCVEQKMKLISL